MAQQSKKKSLLQGAKIQTYLLAVSSGLSFLEVLVWAVFGLKHCFLWTVFRWVTHGVSAYMICDAAKAGVSYDVLMDVYILNTGSHVLSFFFSKSHLLYLLVPAYGIYKLVTFGYSMLPDSGKAEEQQPKLSATQIKKEKKREKMGGANVVVRRR